MEEEEYAEKAKTFVCDKCNFFVNAVSDLVADKVCIRMHDLFTKLEAKTADMYCSMSTAVEEKINKTVGKTIVPFLTQSPSLENVSTDACVAKNSNEENIKESRESSINDSDCSVSNSNLVSETKNISINTDENVKGNLYVCSIEAELSINDIKLILEDAGVHLSNIDVVEMEGDFKRKKFIEIRSEQNVELFKFKLSFMNSKLNGTWFIRSSPPRPPTEKKPIAHSNPATKANTNAQHKQINLKKPPHSSQTTNSGRRQHPPKQQMNFKPSYSAVVQQNNKNDTRPIHHQHRRVNDQENVHNMHYNTIQSQTIHPPYSDALKNNYSNTKVNSFNNYNTAGNYIHKDDFQSFLERVLQQMLMR